jgi:pimeloyl-ACP methyl ester carboxylesterase
MVELTFGDPSLVSRTRRKDAIAEYRRRFALPYAGDALSSSARGLLRAFLTIGPEGLWWQAGQVRCPTLLLYGGRDRLVNPQRARRAARTIPHSHLVMLPRVGHMAQMESPGLVARFVRVFLDGLPAS